MSDVKEIIKVVVLTGRLSKVMPEDVVLPEGYVYDTSAQIGLHIAGHLISDVESEDLILLRDKRIIKLVDALGEFMVHICPRITSVNLPGDICITQNALRRAPYILNHIKRLHVGTKESANMVHKLGYKNELLVVAN